MLVFLLHLHLSVWMRWPHLKRLQLSKCLNADCLQVVNWDRRLDAVMSQLVGLDQPLLRFAAGQIM